MNTISPGDLARLLKERGTALVLYARQWSRTPEDVVQEAFLRLMDQREPPRNPVAWLYRVVRNEAFNAARAAARRKRHESAAAEDGDSHPTSSWFDRSTEQPFDAQEATEALERLAHAERETVVARLWGGLSFEEVAALTGVSTSTAYRRYHSGIQALRERLQSGRFANP